MTLARQLLCSAPPESHPFMTFKPPVTMVIRREAAARGRIRCECLCYWKLMQLHVEKVEDTNQRESVCWSRKPLERELGSRFQFNSPGLLCGLNATMYVPCPVTVIEWMLNLSLSSLFMNYLWCWAHQQHCVTTSPGEELLTMERVHIWTLCWVFNTNTLISSSKRLCLGIIITRDKGDIQGSDNFKNLFKVMQNLNWQELDSNWYCGLQYQGQWEKWK